MTRNTHNDLLDHEELREAVDVPYDNTVSGLSATEVQGAIDEIAGASPGGVSAWKEPVVVATTTAGTLSSSFENGDTIDGIALATGDRILIKDQSTASENGIYVVNASGAPTAATDMDTSGEFVGAVIFVERGTLNGNTVWHEVVGAPNHAFAQLGPIETGFASYAMRMQFPRSELYDYDDEAFLGLGGDATLNAFTGGAVYLQANTGATDSTSGTYHQLVGGSGFDPPHLSSAPSSPFEGLTYYDDTLHKMRTWDGSAWQNHW